MDPNLVFLIIDDNVIDQLVVKKILLNNFETQEINSASNGIEGIQWVCANRNNFKQQLIILLDIRMPEMDGFEFLSAYDKLSDELKRETKIFMLSSTLDIEDINRVERNDYVKKLLSKPLSISEFNKMVY